MRDTLGTFWRRLTARYLPEADEIEQFGADGEETVYRLLCQHFDCVIRNAVVPHKDLYLEKDFMVIHRGVGFVIEVKNWKGEVGIENGNFYQNKDNGVHKTLKNPVGTTNQFIRKAAQFYGIRSPLCGMVVFCSQNQKLNLPESLDGVALLPLSKMISYIKSEGRAKGVANTTIDPSRILRCTRFYSTNSEFCKGILADSFLECSNENGETVRLDLSCLRYLSVEQHHLRMRDKLLVTYTNGASGVFYNRECVLTVACLDGSYQKIALHRLRHIVF